MCCLLFHWMIKKPAAESNDYTSHDPLIPQQHFRRFSRCRTNITRLSKGSQRNWCNLISCNPIILISRAFVLTRLTNYTLAFYLLSVRDKCFSRKYVLLLKKGPRRSDVVVCTLSGWLCPPLRVFPRCKTTHTR